jgi:hypothetical protein
MAGFRQFDKVHQMTMMAGMTSIFIPERCFESRLGKAG